MTAELPHPNVLALDRDELRIRGGSFETPSIQAEACHRYDGERHEPKFGFIHELTGGKTKLYLPPALTQLCSVFQLLNSIQEPGRLTAVFRTYEVPNFAHLHRSFLGRLTYDHIKQYGCLTV